MKKFVVFGAVFAVSFALYLSQGDTLKAEIRAGDVTGGVKAPHVNIAVFHKLHGQESWTYPDHVKRGDILHVLDGKAQFVSINHTAGLKDGDVIVIGNDVLREEEGNFEDFGVDCQLTVHIEAQDVRLSGMCEILMVDQNHREIEHKGIIKSMTMHAANDWQLIYHDEEDGIAVYADEAIGFE